MIERGGFSGEGFTLTRQYKIPGSGGERADERRRYKKGDKEKSPKNPTTPPEQPRPSKGKRNK